MMLKKFLSVAAVLALVVTAVPAKAKAATDVIDFEDGNIPAGLVMATVNDDGVTPDGDPSTLSVVDFAGSKMLKIDTTANGTPKLKFVLAALVGEENVTKVQGIEYDLVIEQPSGEAAGWNGGTIAAGPWAAGGAWFNGVGYTLEDKENSVTAVTHFKEMVTSGFGFADSTGFFMFMNWGNNGTDDYIDNIKILDVDGNAIPLVSAAAVEATDDTAATTTDAAATTDDAAATTTDVPKTGATSFALFFLTGAAVMGVGALVIKRRKAVEE
ncbi:MAG TPA: LPXTG cell wall anchor domain-containing protein [Mobilitalea sp.]|nr:LPXTG cell wall anchor domain-containing protein [Mobilitalea sp.]